MSSRGRFLASFRDPAGYVTKHDGRIFRALTPSHAPDLLAFVGSDIAAFLQREGMLVGTTVVTDTPTLSLLRREHPEIHDFLEHSVITPIGYPHEWTINMLADAGLHTLGLQLRLIQAGWSLKDATAYNVQLRAGGAVFLDLASVERPARSDIWMALGQFHRMFTFPLLLCRHYGWHPRQYFLSWPGGATLDEIARLLGTWGSLHPRCWLDLALPRLLAKQVERSRDGGRAMISARSTNSQAQKINLSRIQRKVGALAAGYHHQSFWAEYHTTHGYSAPDLDEKMRFVDHVLTHSQPRTVLDLGCNTGTFSLMAAKKGATVLAVDADHDAVDRLYLRLKASPTSVYPLCVDITNPSPGLGFRNLEWDPFLQRARSDLVLCLALLHHLMITANLPLGHIAELLGELALQDLIIEHIPPDDPQFRRLLLCRADLEHNVDLESCCRALEPYFHVIKRQSVGGSGRTLLWLKRTMPAEHRES